MRRFKKQIWFCTILVLAGMLGKLSFSLADDPWPRSLQELEAIFSDWERMKQEYNKSLEEARKRGDNKQGLAEKAPNAAPFAEQCLKLAEKYPGTLAEVVALWWAVCHAPDAAAGKKAYERLAKGPVALADLGELATAFAGNWQVSDSTKARGLAPVVLDRVKRSPAHGKAAWLLNWICVQYLDDMQQEAPGLFREAADLIVARYANSPDITGFCQCLGMGTGSPPWASGYEKHLRTILKDNRNRYVRGCASFALASVVHFTGGAGRQDEADKLYQHYLNDFDGTDRVSGSVEKALRHSAQAAREELRWRAVGKLAPELAGMDLEGLPLKLSDHRGKVVLLSFWASWCFPCMKLVPHEQALVERLRDKPFMLLGVNCDTDEETLKETLVKHRITWRSFRDKRADKPAISSEYDILGYPTLYLIDHKGIIRKRWVGAPPPAELDRAVKELVERVAGEGK